MCGDFMIRVGIAGATGYAGSELLRLVYEHPSAEVVMITSQSYAGKPYGEVFENFRHSAFVCGEDDFEKMAEACDVVFLALPHGIAAKKVVPEILEKTRVIDMGADFRLSDADIYEEWYGVEHTGRGLLSEAVYGLCELYREKIAGRRLVANPGCYTTCSILSLYPLLKNGLVDAGSIVIDAKSGVTGAGRGVNLSVHFDEVNESVKAYKVASHRHTPEIEEQLSIAAGREVVVSFTPHLIPMNRGILATCYASLKPGVTEERIRDAYRDSYGGEFFIRLAKPGVNPETKWVKGSNFVDIGLTVDKRTNRVVIVGALDNLVKGAAGQAVQNMNLMFGFDEKTGLNRIPLFPC